MGIRRRCICGGRRLLAACRAVLFAQLVDDPSSLRISFQRSRLKTLSVSGCLILEELGSGRTPRMRMFLRRHGRDSSFVWWRDAGGVGSVCGWRVDSVGSAALGLEAHASDLNPVAVLINKAMIEIPPKFEGQAPVHPDAEIRTRWDGAEGLAEDVRCYGQWMRDEAERRIGHLYPKATLPDGSEANAIAWIWARTVTCPNPACGATMPLARSFWLAKKKGKEAWIKPVVEGKTVRFEIAHDPTGPSRRNRGESERARCRLR